MRLLIPLLAILLAACPSKTTPPPTPPHADPVHEPEPDPPQDDDAVPRFEKQALSASGISAYLPKDFPTADIAPAEEDSGTVYTAETSVGANQYGYIAVKLNQSAGDTSEQQALLIAYLDYLKGSLDVTSAAGYGMGWTTEQSPEAQGIIDYWELSDGTEMQIIGWVTDTHLLVLYISGDDINQSVRDVFFKGVVMP